MNKSSWCLILLLSACVSKAPGSDGKSGADPPPEWVVTKQYSQLDSSLTSFDLTGRSLTVSGNDTHHFLTIYCKHRQPAMLFVSLDKSLSDTHDIVRYRIDSLPIKRAEWLFVSASDIITPYPETPFIRSILRSAKLTLEIVETNQIITFDTKGLAAHATDLESSCPGTLR